MAHRWLRPSEDDVEGRLNRSSLCYICFAPDTVFTLVHTHKKAEITFTYFIHTGMFVLGISMCFNVCRPLVDFEN